MPKIVKKSGPTKPPYRVPPMAEIARVHKNGLKVVSTFSGCGGSCLGFEMAGFEVLWASEFVPAARETYRANHPGVFLDERDIRLVRPEEILRKVKLRKGQLDVLEGSPPCASFSTAGKRQQHWGAVKKYSDVEQRTDDLFFEFVRILRGLMPKVFVAENVSGLIKGTAKGYFLEILKELKDSGYKVRCKVLDAQWLGVPQQRQRTIFVGVRNDLGIEPAFPMPLPYRYSVREAIPWIGAKTLDVASGGDYDKQVPCTTIIGTAQARNTPKINVEVSEDTFNEHRVTTDKPAPSIRAKKAGHLNVGTARVVHDDGGGVQSRGDVTDGRDPAVRAQKMNLYVEAESDMTGLATGRQFDAMHAPGGGSGPQQSDKYFQLVKAAPAEPCPTVTAEGGNAGLASVCHPTQRRKFSIAELKRICAFPDDFVLTGSYPQQWERLGRAVPPLMMRVVAEVVRDQILRKIRK